MPVLHGDQRRHVGQFKERVAVQDVAPEGKVGRMGVALQVGGRHAEREDMQVEGGLAGIERPVGNGVDLFDNPVGHGEAADGFPLAVNHDQAARGIVLQVVLIGIAYIEGQVKIAPRIHVLRADRIEAFGRLLVAFFQFGAQSAREIGDGVLSEEIVAFATLDPEFQLVAFLEDADEDRRSQRQARFLEFALKAQGLALTDRDRQLALRRAGVGKERPLFFTAFGQAGIERGQRACAAVVAGLGPLLERFL